ncbi:MAG: 6-phosphofructokinase [Clostridia bacterium]|nr:6-phosphofructokinase [Clostridia bacterium]
MKELFCNAVVGQSGGPTAAINATLAGVIKGAAKANKAGKIEKLFGMKHGIDGLLSEDFVDLSRYFDEEDSLDLLSHTPAAALGSCRHKLPKPETDPAFFENLIGILKKHKIGYFFYIGGNDSMDTVAKLSRYAKEKGEAIVFMGVPKTIDNDLVGNDHTPGFGSAAKYIAVTVEEIIRDCAVYTVPAVTIVEIMGRDAGWLTAASAIGRVCGNPEPDLVYLPERIFDLEKFFSDLKKAFEKHPNVVAAVSEGIRFADGHYVGEGTQQGAKDVFGHAYLAGTGKALELAVKEHFGCKVRSIELNLPQRCASHLASKTDLDESVGVGSAAVDAAVAGKSGYVMTIERLSTEPYRVAFTPRDVSKIANEIRFVPDEFINTEGNGLTDECCRYLLPLVQGEASCKYQNGLPKFFSF